MIYTATFDAQKVQDLENVSSKTSMLGKIISTYNPVYRLILNRFIHWNFL